jgi:hypothetical protein
MHHFRSHTLARALDVLEMALTSAQMAALVEEMNCGEGLRNGTRPVTRPAPSRLRAFA